MYCAHAGAAGQTQSRMHTHASRHTRACTPNPTNRHQGPGGRDTESTRAATARWWAARTSARVKRRRFAALEHASISLGTRRAERARRASRCRASRLRQGASVAARRIGDEQRRRARAARRSLATLGQTNSNSSAGCLGQHGMDSRPTASRPRWSARSGARTRRGRPQHTRRGSARRCTGGQARRWRPEHGSAQTAP